LDSDDEDEEVTRAAKTRLEVKDEMDDKEKALLGKIGSTMDFDGAKDDFNDGGVQLTAFNMDEENEEGYTDEAGNYHEKKPDATEEADAWLDGISTYVPGQGKGTSATPKASKPERAARPRESVLTEMLAHMKPKEKVLQSISRLGGGGTAKPRKFQLKKQKRKTKTDADAGGGGSGGGSAAAGGGGGGTEMLSKLSGLAHELMEDGDYEIYEATFEKIAHELKMAAETKAKAEAAAASASGGAAAADDDDAVKFVFKWKNEPDQELHGPYTAQQMCDWQDQDYFKAGVWCKEVGKDGDFYNSKRIDFELFT